MMQRLTIFNFNEDDRPRNAPANARNGNVDPDSLCMRMVSIHQEILFALCINNALCPILRCVDRYIVLGSCRDFIPNLITSLNHSLTTWHDSYQTLPDNCLPINILFKVKDTIRECLTRDSNLYLLSTTYIFKSVSKEAR